jgi:hypothetical protein
MGQGYHGCPDKLAGNVYPKLGGDGPNPDTQNDVPTPLVPAAGTTECTSGLALFVPFPVQSPPDVVRVRRCIVKHASAYAQVTECHSRSRIRPHLAFKAAEFH